jgi:hypothetical protein
MFDCILIEAQRLEVLTLMHVQRTLAASTEMKVSHILEEVVALRTSCVGPESTWGFFFKDEIPKKEMSASSSQSLTSSRIGSRRLVASTVLLLKSVYYFVT